MTAKHWDLTVEELRAFVDSLDEERKTMPLSIDQLLSSEVMLAQRKEDRVIALAGMRRIWKLPVIYLIVHRDFQNRGYGLWLTRRLGKVSKNLGIRWLILSVPYENRRSIRIVEALGYRRCFSYRGTIFMFKFL
jgi:ribosomal protein S18 acetylase RimI-like enzyme